MVFLNLVEVFGSCVFDLLAITGVKARDIVGYTALLMILAAIWIAVGLMIF